MSNTGVTDNVNRDGQLRRRPGSARLQEAFIPSPCVQNHAANLMQLPNGDLACVWFGGSQEGKSDISVYMSRLPKGAPGWTEAVRLSHDASRSEQNPILFQTPAGALWLLHTSQHAGNQDTSVIRRQISADNGVTWGASDILIDTPGTFARQPMVMLPNGDWLLPCFVCRTTPGSKWLGEQDTSVVKISSDQGRSWRDYPVPDSLGLVHMNVLPVSGGGLLALFRSRWADRIYESRSSDGGRTWSKPTPTDLPNNNSSIQATRLRDGRLALAFNDVARMETTERRASLYDEIEDDEPAIVCGSAPATTMGREAFWGTPRAPLTVALSSDDGRRWTRWANLEVGDGFCLTNNSADKLNRELSYPSVAQTADGYLHVVFTYHRQVIKHLRMLVDDLA